MSVPPARALALGLLLLLVGCAGSPQSGPPASSRINTPAAPGSVSELRTWETNPIPRLVKGCMEDGDTALVLSGTTIEALAYGEGDTTVVFGHQTGQRPCAWRDYGRALAAKGYRVVLPSLTGAPPEEVYGASAAWALAAGSTRYALVAASMGATYALSAAGSLEPAPAAVIALSAGPDAVAGIASITSPILLVAGSTDGDLAAAAEELKQAQPAATLLVVDGSSHGIELMQTAEVAAAVAAALPPASD